jgi:uncharacterized protein YjdB
MGTQQQFVATGTYSNGSTINITNSVSWTSSLQTTATISNMGLATSKGIGTTTISAASGAVSGGTTLTVTQAQLTAISVTPLTASIPLGTTQQFTATGQYTDGTTQDLTASANWTSSQTGTATVTGGLALPVAPGTTSITASVGAISGSATLTITSPALLSIAVSPNAPSVAAGNTQQFTATGTYTDGSTMDLTSQVSWASGTTTVASINATGLAMTLTAGTAQITATSGSVVGSANLTVTAAVLVSIAVAPAIPTLAVGQTQQFTATGTYSDKSVQDITQTVSWSSADSTIASISMTTGSVGLATGVGQGVVVITATLGVVSGNTTLTVNPAVLVSISVTPSPLSLPKGSTQQLVATGTYSDATTQTLVSGITWSSSDITIATVSPAGQVSAVASAGSATITAQYGSVTGTLSVQVSNATLVSIAVTPSTPSIPAGTTQQFTATGTYTDSSTQDLTGAVQWTSSSLGIATISVSPGTAGLAQTLITGTTQITAALGPVSGMATLTVTPAVLASIAITPLNPSIDLGASQQFTATGTYTDGSTSDITASVTWSASPAGVAVISNQTGSQGLATSSGVGSATITATLGAVSSSTSLTVVGLQLVSIAVSPMTSIVGTGQTVAFIATATYSDGSTNDVTGSVTWSSSDSTIASMSQNMATTVGPGTVTITAVSGGKQGTATLSVISASTPAIVVAPENFSPDTSEASLGGPISLNNFGSAYLQGGFVPTGGAKIDFTSVSPIPTPPLGDYIYHELVGTTVNSVNNIYVSGAYCTEELYTSSFGPISYSNIAVYCPSSSGVTLYKIYLSYRQGDPAEPVILGAFQNVLNNVQFTQ